MIRDMYSGAVEVLVDAAGRRFAARETYFSAEGPVIRICVPACFGHIRKNQVRVQMGWTRADVGVIEWIRR